MSEYKRLPTAFAAALLAVGGTAVPTLGQVDTIGDVSDEMHHAESLSRAFRAVSRSVAPAVVQITAFALPNRGRIGEGSGVIVTADGYIVTNNHVASGADEIQVRALDGREYPATIVGVDVESDLAVLKVDGKDLAHAPFGDSAVVEPGQWVLAIGNPYRFDHTVTAGIVSAVRRSNVGLATFENFIQTDAAINPGNSGGPLVNLRGEIIGINTAISTRTGGYSGLGFAIPSNMVRSVFESIRETGRVERGWLGVRIQPLTPGFATSFGFDGEGALIADVIPDGPAVRAGIRPGDIITQVGTRRVEATADLLNAVAETRPGVRARIRFFRDGRPDELSVLLGERPVEQRRNAQREEPIVPIEPRSELGLAVETLTPAFAARIGAGEVRGVVVVDIAMGSIASQSGLFPGDVIVRVAGREVVDAGEFANIMDGLKPDEPVRLLVWSARGGGRHRFVLLQGGS